MKDRYKLTIRRLGHKFYYKNNGYHRENGPATIFVCIKPYSALINYWTDNEPMIRKLCER